ncbi:mitochondrial import protein Pam17 [Gloeophyllum trabeum ATCC 11539]|uniref:Presequence translocated-associated motor subunit PAM17 n=1 Tax=Gloeophyllum trabeum (strain ATCC 11539 / FP-39264 / Madison 617) TaxID=670483 RepID=S7RT69_GLOTA|nr:mitochondrial import protein Pam17 [Gloeophyllum trabeum ATCC 11539]EPQ57885.1 mitochondrial import protein Pam17 [Gloeophyllum trabeum ATCC 11539]
MNCSRTLRIPLWPTHISPSRNALSRGLVRHNSTVSEQAKQNLSWPEYLAIRKSKRRWETAATIPCVFLGFGGGVLYFGNLETDASKLIMGIDPFFFYGFATLGCAGFGYLIGPTIGSAFWRMTHRRTMALIEARDREFHKHIVKNRVDPTAQTATNPVPDFYGEKIGSLHEYRQWLRDQAKYKRKSEWPEEL